MAPRDSQRSKVYKWENRHVSRANEITKRVLTLAEAQALSDKIHKEHGMTPIKVRFGSAKKKAYFSYGNLWRSPEIVLSKQSWSQTVAVVVHEIAHSIHRHYFPKEAGHGPGYVRVYMDLLAKYCKLNLADMRESAKLFRLKIAQRPEYHPGAITHGTIPKVPVITKPAVNPVKKKLTPRKPYRSVVTSTGTKIDIFKPTPMRKAESKCDNCGKPDLAPYTWSGMQICESCNKKFRGA